MRTQQTLYAENLPEIPSELIEPYALRWMMMQIEAVAIGITSVPDARLALEQVERFICCFSGIHAEYATTNEYRKLLSLDDATFLSLCKQVYTDV